MNNLIAKRHDIKIISTFRQNVAKFIVLEKKHENTKLKTNDGENFIQKY